MKWIQHIHKRKSYTTEFINPFCSGDYWVTDGYYVHMAHYDFITNDWGIYQPDKTGVIKHCYSLDDMNFCILAYAEMKFPKGKEKFRNLL